MNQAVVNSPFRQPSRQTENDDDGSKKPKAKKEMFTLIQSGEIQRVLFHLLEELLK